MRCMTALDQRTCPSGVMATTASCMESSMAASSWRLLSSLGKVLAQPLGGLVQRGFHGGEFVVAGCDRGARSGRRRRCGGQSRPRAAGASGTRRCGPRRQRKRNRQRDQARPECLAAQANAACLPRLCSTKRRKTNSITSGLEDQQKDEKSEQLGEYFSVMKKQLLAVAQLCSTIANCRSLSRC